MSYHRQSPKRAEDYTDAFFASFGLLVFVVLWTIASVAGFAWVLITAWCIDKLGTIALRRAR